MKDLLVKYAHYNIWANQLFIETCQKLKDDLLEKEIVNSFPSIKTTIIHIWSAEDIWMQRLNLVEKPVFKSNEFDGGFHELYQNWKQSSNDIMKYIEKSNDELLTSNLQYSDLKGNIYQTPKHYIIQHVFNHSTSHRGQLITMLRQLGTNIIPKSDFIHFVRQ